MAIRSRQDLADNSAFGGKRGDGRRAAATGSIKNGTARVYESSARNLYLKSVIF